MKIQKSVKKFKAYLLIVILFFIGLSQMAASWNNPPVLIRISDAVKPTKLITINGEGLDSGLVTIAMALDLTGTSPLAPTTGWLAPQIVQYDNRGNFIVVRFPHNIPAGVYNVWIQNSYGWSKPIKLNAPRAQFLSENEAWSGQYVEVVGRNFDGNEFGAVTSTIVRLNDGNSVFTQSIVTLNPYNVKFKISSASPTGTYNVEVSNDGGIHWSQPSSEQILTIVNVGNDNFNLGVSWANDFVYNTVYNVTQYSVPVSSGTDVTAQIQNVIDLVKTQGGGIIYFPNGTYKVRGLALPAKIILQGQDMFLTQIQYSINPNSVLISTKDDGNNGTIGLYNLSLGLANPSDSLKCTFFWPQTYNVGEKIFLKKVNMYYQPTIPKVTLGNGPSFVIFANQKVNISNSRFIGWSGGCNLSVKKYVGFKNNYIETSNNIMLFTGAAYSFIENDTLKGHAPNNVDQNSGFSFRDFVYLSDNYVESIGSTGNDGEAFMGENPGGTFNYGYVTLAGPTQIVCTPQSTTNPIVTPTTSLYYGTLSLQITSGRGVGQMRKVVSITSSTINVDKPWDIIPDTTSKWTLILPLQNSTLYNNNINNCRGGYWLYGNWFDGVVANNISTNSGGILIRSAVVFDTEFNTCYFNRIVKNTIVGVSWFYKSAPILAIGERFNPNSNGNFSGVLNYGLEIKENFVFGDLSQVPIYGTLACIGLVSHLGTMGIGGYYNGNPIARDILNTVIEDNMLKNARYGLDISKGNYGVVHCNNTFQNITINTFSIQPQVVSVVESSCNIIYNGIEKNFIALEEIKIYPNPTQNIVTFELINTEQAIKEIAILNALGQEVLIEKNIFLSNKTIDISKLLPGIYFTKILTVEDKESTIKIVKI